MSCLPFFHNWQRKIVYHNQGDARDVIRICKNCSRLDKHEAAWADAWWQQMSKEDALEFLGSADPDGMYITVADQTVKRGSKKYKRLMVNLRKGERVMGDLLRA